MAGGRAGCSTRYTKGWCQECPKIAEFEVEPCVVGHSPLRVNQDPDLVALVGRLDVDESAPALQRIDSTGLTIEPDRMFYLVPTPIVRLRSTADGRSTARALMPHDAIQQYEVDLTQALTQGQLLTLISSR